MRHKSLENTTSDKNRDDAHPQQIPSGTQFILYTHYTYRSHFVFFFVRTGIDVFPRTTNKHIVFVVKVFVGLLSIYIYIYIHFAHCFVYSEVYWFHEEGCIAYTWVADKDKMRIAKGLLQGGKRGDWEDVSIRII